MRPMHSKVKSIQIPRDPSYVAVLLCFCCSCIGGIGVEWGCRIVIYGAFACGYVLPIVSWGRITIQFVPFFAVVPCFSFDPSFTFLCLDAMILTRLICIVEVMFRKNVSDH